MHAERAGKKSGRTSVKGLNDLTARRNSEGDELLYDLKNEKGAI